MTARAADGSASRANEYADVPEMFRELELVCLPAHRNSSGTDKIAVLAAGRSSRGGSRVAANRVTTLFRSRGSWLVNAAVRFDVDDRVGLQLPFAVPTIMGETSATLAVKVPWRLANCICG